MAHMSLSVVVPVYNEQDVIEKVVRSIHKNIISKLKDSELILINDCSTDSTLQVLKKLSRKLDKIRVITPSNNGGHGKAIRLGFLNSKKEWVFHIDSDNQFDSADFWKLYKFIDNYDYIYGYRKKRHDPVHRKVLTMMIRSANMLVFGTFLKDTNSAFKLIKNRALQQILRIVPEDAFTPSIMITLLAKKLGYRIKIIPVEHRERETGKVSIQGRKLVKVCIRGAKEMINFRLKNFNIPEKEFRLAQEIRENN
ncbi:glycosyltransferase family 2 protein [Candidatus Woesearchaeota archaeon]|nr:glycosyltransferase family 2 protein [Candidatus Woesearchaeota archaeon]